MSSTVAHLKSATIQCMSVEDVISAFNKVHNNKYDYSKMRYINNKTKVEIICSKHGSFWQVPSDHKKGTKCPTCARIGMALNKTKSITDVLHDFKEVHGDTYIYDHVHYKNAWTAIDIRCKVHGVFSQTPEHHRRGSGCPACTATGFNPLKPAILYYVKVVTGEAIYYKIGITNRSVKERFGKDFYMITVLKEWKYEVGADAYQAEQNILKLNTEYRYTREPVLVCGNTEMFIRDVGELDE